MGEEVLSSTSKFGRKSSVGLVFHNPATHGPYLRIKLVAGLVDFHMKYHNCSLDHSSWSFRKACQHKGATASSAAFSGEKGVPVDVTF